jgi:hypothetical protein
MKMFSFLLVLSVFLAPITARRLQDEERRDNGTTAIVVLETSQDVMFQIQEYRGGNREFYMKLLQALKISICEHRGQALDERSSTVRFVEPHDESA